MNKIVDQLCLVHIVTAAASKFMKIFCPYENSNRHDLAPLYCLFFTAALPVFDSMSHFFKMNYP
jgi:hypothetical protein